MKEILRKYRGYYAGAILFSVIASVFLSLFSIRLGAVIDVILQPDGGLVPSDSDLCRVDIFMVFVLGDLRICEGSIFS